MCLVTTSNAFRILMVSFLLQGDIQQLEEMFPNISSEKI